MKHLSKLLFLLLAPAVALAQPTLTQADLPAPGVKWIGHVNTSSNFSFPLTPGGPAQTWNIAASFSQTDTFNVHFITPAAVPPGFAKHFPNADLAIYEPAYNNAIFYKTNASGFYMDGYVNADTPADTSLSDLNPDRLLLPVPFAYTNIRNDVSKLVRVDLAMGEKSVEYSYQTITADAYGSLTLPSGTYPNTLRCRVNNSYLDSSFVLINGNWMFTGTNQGTLSDSYLWFQNGSANLLLLEASEDSQSPGNSSSFAIYYTASVLSAHTALHKAQVPPFPNPATTQISIPIETAGAERLLILDITGRELASETVRDINQLRYSTAHLPAGAYSYQVSGKNQEVLQRGKFTVVR